MSQSPMTFASPVGDGDPYSTASGAVYGRWPGGLEQLQVNGYQPPGDFRLQDKFNFGTQRYRQPGKCKDLNGTSQYCTLPSAIGLTGAFAISAWVYPDAINTRTIIGGATDAHVQLTLTGYSVRLINAGAVVTGGSALATGAWSHLLFERDGANAITVRVNNGAPTTLGTIAGTTTFDRLFATASAAFFDGKVHDLRIFNRVLTADERADLAGGVKLGPLPTYWWKLDSSYSFEADCSGSGAHAFMQAWASSVLYSGTDVRQSFENEYGWADIGNATNIIAAPNTFVGWTATSATVFDAVVWDPITGSQTASRLYGVVAASEHKIQLANVVTSTDGRTPYTFRVDLRKYGTQDRVGVAIGDSTLAAFCQVQVNLATGAVVANTNATWSVADSRIEPLNGGWYRVWVTGVPAAAVTDVQTAVRLFDATGTASWGGGGASSGVLIANAKLSKGECRGGRNEANISQDVWGNTLDYTGRCPIRPKLINSNCLTLNGTTQLVTFTGPTIWDTDGTQAMDISGWFKTSAGATQGIVGNMLTTGSFAGWVVMLSAGGNLYFYLISTITTNMIEVHTASGYPLTLNDGLWHNFRITYDGSKNGNNVVMYVDGVRYPATVATNNLTGSTTTTAPSNIGGRNSSNFFSGQLAGINVTIGANSWTYPLAEGTGATVYNARANANHGTIGAAGTNWSNLQSVYHYNMIYGFRDSTGLKIPALISGVSAADGNAITNPATGHNDSETKINWSSDSTSDPFIRYVGGTVPTAHYKGLALPTNFTSDLVRLGSSPPSLYLNDSFEYADQTAFISAGWTQVISGALFDTTYFKVDAKSLNLDASAAFNKSLGGNYNPVELGVWVRFNSASYPAVTRKIIRFQNSSGFDYYVSIGADGSLKWTNAASADVATSAAAAVPFNTWFWLKIKFTCSDSISAGTCQIYKDGVLQVDLPAATDTNFSGTANVAKVGLMGSGVLADDLFYDQLQVGPTNSVDLYGAPVPTTNEINYKAVRA